MGGAAALFDITNGWEGVPPFGQHVVVVTHKPPTDWPFPDAPFTFVSGIEEAVAKAKELAGDRDISLAAGNLTGQALRAGLIDELSYNLVPVIFGTGKKLRRHAAEQILLDDPKTIEVTGSPTCTTGSAKDDAITVRDPGATSVKPASWTTGRPLVNSCRHCAGLAVRTASANSLAIQSLRASADNFTRRAAPHGHTAPSPFRSTSPGPD